MAKANGDGSIVLSTDVDTGGLKKGLAAVGKMASVTAKAFLAIGAAAGAATVAITKMAVSAYADYEQLVGGVETLFKDSADTVLKYANDAFRTTGQSANEYMANVTAFSASLISSLGGDTAKAAEVANQAMISMADNANKMGTPMESVQMAFQGFAKGQYMLLDNLKLGYGGTKTEMERLLKDAQAITGVKYDINNLADVYTAIGVIQEKLGIAGTTAKEAEKTISGSLSMMKASWQNTLSAIAGGGDLEKAIDNLVYSISKVFDNLSPVIQRSLVGIGKLIEKVAPLLVQNVATALIESIPSLLNAIYQMILGLAKGIWDGIKALFSGGGATSQINAEISAISATAEDASAGVEAIGDSAEEAGKKAKKALAGFDDLQILSSNSGGGAEAPSVGVPQAGSAMFEATTEAGGLEGNLENSNSFLDTIRQKFVEIADIAKGIWNSDEVQVFVGAMETNFETLKLASATAWDDISSNASLAWSDIETNCGTMADNVGDLWVGVWSDIDATTQEWSPTIIQSISDLFNDVCETGMRPYLETATGIWASFAGELVTLWDLHGAPILDKVGEAVNGTIELFQNIYDNIIEPFVRPFLEKLSGLWDEHISKLIFAIGDFTGKLYEGALDIYNKFILPVVNYFVEELNPTVEFLGDLFSSVFGSIIETLSNTGTEIFEALGGFIDWIVGTFTGDWEKAWQGVYDVVTNIFEGFDVFFKGLANIVIDALNALIRGINKINFEVPDWVPGMGGKSWGFSIPQIPRLAQGAVIPPNREFLAVLGDQKHGTNIEAPLDTIVEAFNIALSKNSGASGSNTIVLEVDGREFGRAVIEQGNKENRRIGTRLVTV